MDIIANFGNKINKVNEKEPSQIRYSLDQKAQFVAYMFNREQSEKKSNLSWYAEHQGVSRTSLYKFYHRFTKVFGDESPGPEIDASRVLASKLQEELRKKEDQYETLRKTLGEQQAAELEEHQERLVRTILQAAVSPMTPKEIRDLIETAFGVKISKRKIKALIAVYAGKARQILQDMGVERMVEFLAVDEIFAGSKPILTGVELNSFAVVICERADSRDHTVWQKALNLFPHVKLVTSDRATGIIKAVYLCDVEHQFDLFHFKRDAARLLRQLEARAYQKIDAEYKAEAKVKRIVDEQPKEASRQIYLQCRQEALVAIESLDQAEKAMELIYEGLEIFDGEGNFYDPEQSLKKLERGATMLGKASQDKKVLNVVEQVRNPHLRLYLANLRDRLLAIELRWRKEVVGIPRSKLIKIIAHYWYCVNEQSSHLAFRANETRRQWKVRKVESQLHFQRTILANLLRLRQLQLQLANFEEVFAKVVNTLDIVFRSSSLVESFNSHIRICQQVKKDLQNDYLCLNMLKWNTTPFEHGKRKGLSPYQILGIQPKRSNWLDILMQNTNTVN